MNKCNVNFINRNGIDFSLFDTRIYTIEDINSILKKYEVQGSDYNINASLANILGFYEKDDKTLQFPDVLDDLFDELGDGYHNRSVGLLLYDSNTILDKIIDSFMIEPIKTMEVDNGKHVIFTNGMHRFAVLRLLYLNELGKCKSSEEIEKLNQKFTIPVIATKIDLVKTYCKYLIDIYNPASIMGNYYESVEKENDYYFLTKIVGWGRKELVALSEEEYQDYLNSVINLSAEYDSNYNMTGRTKLKKFNGEELILTDEELIVYTRSVIKNSKRNNTEIFDMINRYPSFKEFINIYFNDLFDLERGIELNDRDSKRL